MKTVRRGEVLLFRFSETPTTGFRWEVSGLPDGAKAVTRFEPASAGTGASGDRVFELTFSAVGSHDITFALRRAWDPPTQVVSAHTVRIGVE